MVISDNPNAVALSRAREVGVPAFWIDAGPKAARVSKEAAASYVETLRAHAVDLICLAGFMRIIGRSFFEAYGGRIVNIHPSLLPAFRGLHGQRQALEAGVKIAGCTVHYVTPELDAGPIIIQAAVPVGEDDTEEILSARILREEHRIYPEAIRLIEAGRTRTEGNRVRVLPSNSERGGGRGS